MKASWAYCCQKLQGGSLNIIDAIEAFHDLLGK
jgi:hypothetical protein